jgi:hypothetical protein
VTSAEFVSYCPNLSIIFFVALVSGCVSVEVTHDLSMDGTSDITVEANGSEFAVSRVESELDSSGIMLQNAYSQRRDGYFNYSFYNVPAELLRGSRFEEEDVELGYSRDPGLIYDKFRIEINSSEIDFGTNGFSNMLKQQASINYRLNYFGELQDTNGKTVSLNGKDYVVFDLTENKRYFIEFKAFKPSLVYSRTVSNINGMFGNAHRDQQRCKPSVSRPRREKSVNCSHMMFESP